LQEKYRDRDVQVLIIDVMEPEATATGWGARWQFPFPVLLDANGKVAESYAPPDAVPDLPRSQVPIASNLIIDREGKIRFYSLLDSANFDARLVALQARMDELLAASPPVVTVDPPTSVALVPGRPATARLSVRIRPGFHVQANPASEPYLVPLTLALQPADGVRAGPVAYPPGRPWRLTGSDGDLSVYSAGLELVVALEAPPELAASGVLQGDLRYQACDDRVCLRPASVPVRIPFRCDDQGECLRE